LEVVRAKPVDMHGIIPCEAGMHLLMVLGTCIKMLDSRNPCLNLMSLLLAVYCLSEKDFDYDLRALNS
ncbi:MAG: hypothetical protein AB2693_23485, partial [Candidatus Thiodiazotropha sp.]